MMGIVFIAGLAIGSFLNAYIWRLHSGGSVWRGRSYCPKCKKGLAWYELIPLVSFFVQLGRCRGCNQKIDWQYPLVEFVTGILFILVFVNIKQMALAPLWREDLAIVVSWYLLAVLTILFVFDLRYGLVPDEAVLPAIVIAMAYNIILSYGKNPNHNYLLPTTYYLLAVAIGAGFFALQYWFSKGKWLGAGDIRIGALMGAMVGWPYIFEAIIISYIIGGFVGVFLLINGRKKFGQTLPLGTFLTLGTAIVFLYGEQLWRAYWKI
ncbi:hypothetical protein A3H11_03075 [Candidatus Uhrbacteria bacterium RIFCSPLOWO2_12_FULL_47_10]|nr:MAG: hypothetical protein A2753_04465 [Candidatus Uhrbacteria bacterium RIFCSPHIGHO2_01_FULL_47_11]OGL84609.1 MAG: hypothetical protein A3J03_02285 [Candidatus Uhrbacteria bacterium RIFCSPLOWO2_02_FULL_46_25]OGL92990.1 MAG: hypothetical protein A3H11_03075 [Candidatus Uhrbacteria bacterium RIFCSPLOWO2_12_FULL_47_10]